MLQVLAHDEEHRGSILLSGAPKRERHRSLCESEVRER